MELVMLYLPFLSVLLLIGAVAGVIAGLLGVGGGIVLVPAFYYIFGALGYGSDQLMQIALATSLATIIVTSARSLAAHHRKGAVDWDILRAWAPGIALGAGLGVLVAARVSSDQLTGLFGALAMLIGFWLMFGRASWTIGDVMPSGLRRVLIAPVIGLLSVLMGIGGGSFGVPLMTLYSRPIHRAVATAAGFGIVIAVPGVIGFLLMQPEIAPPLSIGAVNIPAFLVVISMTLLTAPIGAGLAHRLNPVPLRRIFALFLIGVALNMLLGQ